MALTIIGVFVLTIGIAALEVPYLRRKQMTKEMWIFFVILGAGCLLCILLGMRVPIPNPMDVITMIYKPISDFVFTILQ
ncbi:hypothetical protein [Paenibacillus sp. N3.4]|uniref:hypothetical protein n=1 Tax=Paenibacillus sp. N3.4 TaxID=2603222 RepID=UPI0011CB9EF8|nr:hypothetical protein [Paenibacillus sp. N3.4]TXK84791.1 hypothetical protein FU659_06935 [Paenibacillus sp. N3.4]